MAGRRMKRERKGGWFLKRRGESLSKFSCLPCKLVSGHAGQGQVAGLGLMLEDDLMIPRG